MTSISIYSSMLSMPSGSASEKTILGRGWNPPEYLKGMPALLKALDTALIISRWERYLRLSVFEKQSRTHPPFSPEKEGLLPVRFPSGAFSFEITFLTAMKSQTPQSVHFFALQSGVSDIFMEFSYSFKRYSFVTPQSRWSHGSIS